MMRLNPIHKKELKQNARTEKTALIIFFYNAILSVFGLFALFLVFNNNQKRGYHVEYSDILTIYGIIIGIEYVLILFIIPAMTAGSISGEREKQTLEILLTTRISTLQIVLGKLASSISMMLLLAFSSMPIVAMVFSIGGISFMDLIQFMLLIITTAIFLGSIGIFFSSLCKKTTAATVCSYITVLVLTGGLAIIIFGINLLNPELGKGVSSNISYEAGYKYSEVVFILLINPLFSFLALLNRQTGIGTYLGMSWNTQDQIRYFIANHWVECSQILQLIISCTLLVVSSKLLKPRKAKS